MKFYQSKGEVVRLVDLRAIPSKSGDKMLHFVKVANTTTYESADFMLSNRDCDPASLEVGKDYDIVVDIEGRFSNAVLLPISTK